MHRRVTGPAHLRAHRFARRRVEWALTLGTTLPDHDPGRLPRRCTVASYALAVVMLAVAGVLAIAQPAPDWSGAAVLVDSDSGAVFLHRDGVLHPALNLTSALLAADRPTPVDPLTVSAEDIAGAPRGRMLGIMGAPAALPPQDRLFATGWSLCDASGAGGVVTSTAVVGVAAPGRTLSVEEAVLVVDAGARGVRHAFLLWAGRRLPVDLEDRPLVQALGLEGVTPRPVSPALLAALPTADPVEVAAPTGAGSPGAVEVRRTDGGRVDVGTVLRSAQADGRSTLQLVHRDGVESITPVMADLLLARTGAALVEVDTGRLGGLRETREQRSSSAGLPAVAPRLAAASAPVVCLAWQGTSTGWSVTTAVSLDPATPVVAVGGSVDQVQVAPGGGAVVRRADGNGGLETGFLVTDLGVAHPVGDDVPERLGLTAGTHGWPDAPSAVLDVLPPGPALATESADRIWDPGIGSAGSDGAPVAGAAAGG